MTLAERVTEVWFRQELAAWKPRKKDAIRWLSTPNPSFPQNMAPIQMLALGHTEKLAQHVWSRRRGIPH